MSGDPVARWQQQLCERVGVEAPEVAERCHELAEFCRARGLSPAELLGRWQDFPELLVRRQPRSGVAPYLAVESYLIHNGVNVFGDIVCVAGRPEDLVLQGPQFVPGGAA